MKKLSLLLILALMLSLFSCGGTSEEEETDAPLNDGSVQILYVYNWGEYISDGYDDSVDVNKEFERYCEEVLGKKVKVNYSTYASNEDMYAKISTGAVRYDVIIPSDYMISRMAKEGLLKPLNQDLIPNYENISDAFKGENVYYEPNDGNLYSVPYSYGVTGIIYNTEIVPDDNENLVNESWNLMWDESLAGDILQYNNNRDAFSTAQYLMGFSVNSEDPETWKAALEKLKVQKELVQGYVMDEIFNKMENGSAAVASYYVGDFLTMYGENDSLAFYYPREGTNRFVDAMCVPYNAPSADLAMEYINFMCSEEIAVANAEFICYASPNTLVRENEDYIAYMEEIHPEAMDLLYGYEEKGIPLEPYHNLTDEQLTLLNDLWEELKVESSIGQGIYIGCGIILGCLLVFAGYEIYRKHRWSKLYD